MTNINPVPVSKPEPAIVRRNTRRYALYGALFGLAFPVLAIAVSLAYGRLPWSLSNIAALHAQQPMMWIIDTAPIFLGAFAALAGLRQDEVVAERSEVAQRAQELGEIRHTLEQRVDERTQELEERDRQMRSAVQATRQMSQIRDTTELAATAVQLMAQSLKDFSVDLYLLDERRSEAILVASSQTEPPPDASAGGAVKVGDPGIVGQVAASGESGRVSTSATGPELALPLLARGRPLGVLHFRALHSTARLPADTELLQLIADQLASAFETARLFDESSHALQQLEAVSAQTTQSAWQDQAAHPRLAFEYSRSGIRPARPASATVDPGSLRIPVELRGQKIGTIALTRRGAEGWTDADRDLAQKTADQVALALENVRLLEETRERALQEQMLSEFSARLGKAVDLDSLLQTAVRELATLPEVADASIYLNPSAPADEKGPS